MWLRYHMHCTRRSVKFSASRCFGAFLIVLSVTGSSLLAQGTRAQSPRMIAEFDTRAFGDFFLLPVTLGDEDRLFLVDTGSVMTLFDATLEGHLGARVDTVSNFATPGATIKLPRFRAPEAPIGSLLLSPRMVVGCLDLKALRHISGMDVRGILGADFFRDYVVQFDFDNACLRFLTAVGNDVGAEVRLLDFADPRPFCRCKVGDGDEDFLIDTGLVGLAISLRPALFDELLQESRQPPQHGASCDPLLVVTGMLRTGTVDGVRCSRYGRLRSIRVGALEAERISVLSGRCSRLGLGLLSEYLVTFDFPQNKMYLKEAQKRPIENKTGVGLKRVNSRTFVDDVDRGSPGAVAGLAVGDEVLTVAGLNAKETSIFALRKLMRNDGTEIELTVTRDGSPIRILLGETTEDSAKWAKKWGPVKLKGVRAYKGRTPLQKQ